jgi:hypothetical protein
MFGYWKIRIGDKIKLIGDLNNGYWAKNPAAYPVPPPGLGVGRAGGFIEAEWVASEKDVTLATVKIKMSVVRDQARFEFTLTNSGAATQNIGLQMNGDVMVDANDSSGFAFLPGSGYVRSSASLTKSYGTVLTGSAIPEVFETYDSVENPVTVARNTLKLQDCVSPDYVAIGEWGALVGTANWVADYYKPDPMVAVNDLAWALVWNPRVLGPGGSRKIVTYYGVGAANAVWNYRIGTRMEQDSVAFAVQGPRSLKYDSTKTEKEYIDPASFDIKAYIYNLATDPGPYELADVSVSLYLPPGLELTTIPQQNAQQPIGRVQINSESLPATWTVHATGEYLGELEYFVTARDVSGWQQVVSRKIMVTATKKSVFRNGYQMMCVPFTFNNNATDHAFGLTPGSFAAKYYDPVTGQYLPVKQVKPGQAFWMYVAGVAKGRTQPFQLAADAAIIGEEFGKQSREQYVDLKPGWNLIGNPFVYPVYWGQVAVYDRASNLTVSLDQAVTNGWLSKTVFSWLPASGAYESFKDNSRFLMPWRGYWVRAKSPIALVFRPAVAPGSDVTAKPGGY